MSLLQFSSPPLPHYIISGLTHFPQGFRHVNRHNINVFDLLVVREGCLYLGEEDRKYEVQAGEALILRPDCHHYGTADCREDGSYYWLHFQTPGPWCSASCHAEAPVNGIPRRSLPITTCIMPVPSASGCHSI